MSNFNYKNAKFILFLSTQFGGDGCLAPYMDGTIHSSKLDNLKKLIIPYRNEYTINASGYVLMPKMDDKIDKFGINTMDDIKDSEKGTTYMDDCINKIYNFINTALDIDDTSNFWIGTPEINSKNFGKLDSNTSLTTLCKYVQKLKEKLDSDPLNNTGESRDIWNKHIKGFFYNQECIYGDVNYKDLMSNKEIKLMNDFSYYVHNSMPVNGDKNNLIPIEKDLIWVPYLPTDIAGTLTEAETYKRVCAVIERTSCFDCAFIQPHLIYKYNLEYDNKPKDTIESNVLHGKQNIQVICKAMENSYLSYRDNERVLDKEYIESSNNRTRKCIYGAEYELNGDWEFKSGYDEKEKIFKYYGAFDNYVNKNPMLFYWHGNTKIPQVSTTIRTKYNTNDAYNINGMSLNNNCKGYADALSNTVFKTHIKTMEYTFVNPQNNSLTLDLSNCGFYKGEESQVSYSLINTYIADHPELFWINDISATYTDDGKYITGVKLDVESKYNSTILNLMNSSFQNEAPSILNNLNIPIVNPLNNNEMTVELSSNADNTDSFIKIHNWLTDNVEYQPNSEFSQHNCAYGPIKDGIRKATSKGFSTALSVLCKMAGIPCLVVPGTKDGITHYWNYVNLEGEWRFVDASLNISDDNDPYKYRYFLRKMPDSYFISYSLPKVNIAEYSLIQFGDIDGDGKILSTDAAIAVQIGLDSSLKEKHSLKSLIAADVTGDGDITREDGQNIMSRVLDSKFEFPVETKIKSYL